MSCLRKVWYIPYEIAIFISLFFVSVRGMDKIFQLPYKPFILQIFHDQRKYKLFGKSNDLYFILYCQSLNIFSEIYLQRLDKKLELNEVFYLSVFILIQSQITA